MALRDGFIIPNSGTYAPDYQTSQPDQGDFLVLGNSRYGVVSGCKVSLQGGAVVIAGDDNVVVINGQLISIPAGTSSITISGANLDPRFDLVVVDINAGLTAVQGTPQANPVFPDVPGDSVVLAAIYTNTNGDHHVIDKRKFLQPSIFSIQTDISPYYIIKHHAAGTLNVKFSVDGDGKISWGDGTHAVDTFLERDASGRLKITSGLNVNSIEASGSITVAGHPVITGDNIQWGTTANRPANADVGDLYIDTNSGTINIWKAEPAGTPEKWMSVQPNVPSGTVIMSFLPSLSGYLRLDGSCPNRSLVGNLWNLHPEWRETNEANEDCLRLPDLTGRFPIGATSVPSSNRTNVEGGTVRDSVGTIGISLATENLPRHRHHTDTATAAAGSHTHTASVDNSGSHTHTVDPAGWHKHPHRDNGHHHGWENGAPIVAVADGSHDGCTDSAFADSSHNYRTRPSWNSESKPSNIDIEFAGTHTHTLSGGGLHSHVLTVTSAGSHTHALPAQVDVGENKEVTFAPPSLSLYFYIKT